MNKNVNPVLIAVAVVALLGFCYFMYRVTQPNVSGPYDARNGPPAYVNQMKNDGNASTMPQAPGKAPSPSPK